VYYITIYNEKKWY